jgi:hypothetical protein
MPAEKKGGVVLWQVSPSEHERPHVEHPPDPPERVDAYSPPSIWTDVRNLLLLILALVVIVGVIYERWFFLPQQHEQPNTAPPNAPTPAPTTKPSTLLPFCPPERDECWR